MQTSEDENLFCDHTFLPQTQYPRLPPLYIAQPLHPQANTQLQHAYICLGPLKPRSPFLGFYIKKLRKELEGGMIRERREQMQNFVNGIEDLGKRKAAEVYLARYPGFMFDGDGRLDYGTETWCEVKEIVVVDRLEREREKDRERRRGRIEERKKESWWARL